MNAAPARGASCPICRKPVRDEHRPFCSERCRTIDLGRWLGGAYAIPAVEAERPERDGEADA